jgi:hypothetical protein
LSKVMPFELCTNRKSAVFGGSSAARTKLDLRETSDDAANAVAIT